MPINALKAKQDVNPLLKLVLEMGPLVIFFITNSAKGMIYATGALMIATLISLVASKVVMKRIPVMPLVTGAFVLVFGTLTIYFNDDTFIKIKPTLLNLLFAATLGGGLFFRKLLLKIVLGEVLQMHDSGWRLLTLRWIGFFLFLALMNEIVRRYFEEAWAAYKAFGVMPLTFLFMMAQITLIMKYQLPQTSPEASKVSTT